MNAWVDPGKEKDGVAALVAQGADVISGSPNTPVQGLAAKRKACGRSAAPETSRPM